MEARSMDGGGFLAPACRLAAVFVCLIAWTVPQAAPVVQFGTNVRYLANSADPGLDMTWTDPQFEDQAWPIGSYGIGYDTDTVGGAASLLRTTVPVGTLSVYTRVKFSVPHASTVTGIDLGADYDDGYVVWLNGTEVYRSPEVPAGPLAWNTSAANHESSNASSPVYLPLNDISAAGLPALVNGVNWLSIAVFNYNPTSTDLVLVPQLTLEGIELTRGPYLQLASPNGIVVRWRTASPTPSRVLYGTTPGSLGTVVFDPQETTEHVVPLTGLAPDTRYYYAVGTSSRLIAGGDADHFFVTSPPAGSYRPTRIWAIGDSGTADANARSVFDAYTAFTGNRQTDLWLMLGDNAYVVGNDTEYQAAVFDTYPELLRSSPLWPSLGNHDSFSADSPSQTGPYYDIFTLPANAQAGGVASGTEAYYSFDYANIHFVVLDSMDTDRSPAGAMLTWLTQDLAATAQDWVIAYWHHPPYSRGSHDSDLEIELVEMRENVLPILDAYGVDLTLTGHSHSYERSFLLDGHYGTSATFGPQYVVDGGDGQTDGDGAYRKPQLGTTPHHGIVHTVCGSSGSIQGGALDHPAMYVSFNVLGSLVLDVAGNRLDLQFLDARGGVLDHFTMRKGPSCPNDPADDADADGVCGDVDNCPALWNAGQANGDGDGTGDACDACPLDAANDVDGDTICGNADNCPAVANVDQVDLDADGSGNACDPDDDGDTTPDGSDCAPLDRGVSSAPAAVGTSLKLLRSGTAAVMSWSRSNQGYTYNVYRGIAGPGQRLNGNLSCLVAETPSWTATDAPVPGAASVFYYFVSARNSCAESIVGTGSNGVPRVPAIACAAMNRDSDNDGHPDLRDHCPLAADPSLADQDADFSGNACDNCLAAVNPDQSDSDQDGAGNACDNCASLANAGQQNADGDTLGDACDLCPTDPWNDQDGDALCAGTDNCPSVANAGQADANADGIGDACTMVPVTSSFAIAATEVTNAEWAAFLNAVAAADPRGLFNGQMQSQATGGISRAGSPGLFSYTVKPSMGGKPVNFISWLDALRYVNWLHHGKPTGAEGPQTTDTGAYDLTVSSPGTNAVRSPQALWFLPTQQEWDAAAYADGTQAQSWTYPTRSHTAPTPATATNAGDVANPARNVANYDQGAIWNGQTGNVTTVAGAGRLSTSRAGTYDQGGNVAEWVETATTFERKGVRGGSFDDPASALQAGATQDGRYTEERETVGFRVAKPAP